MLLGLPGCQLSSGFSVRPGLEGLGSGERESNRLVSSGFPECA